MENNEVEPNPFALKIVTVGNEEISARPIRWDKEMYYQDGRAEDGEFMVPVFYEGVCPACSQMIQFDNICSSVQCEHCGTGEMKRDVAIDNPFTEMTLDIDALIQDEEVQSPEIPLDMEGGNRPVEKPDVIEIKTEEKKKKFRKPKKEDVSTPVSYDDYLEDPNNDLNIEDLIK